MPNFALPFLTSVPSSEIFRAANDPSGNESQRPVSIICEYKGQNVSKAYADRPIISKQPYVVDLTPFGASWLTWLPGSRAYTPHAWNVTKFLTLQAVVAKRPLQPSEADATLEMLISQAYKQEVYLYGGLIAGTAFHLWTKQKNPFPLPFKNTRGKTFNPNFYRLLWSIPIKGSAAPKLHHWTSVGVYVLGMGFLSAFIGGVVTEAELAIRLGTDPRTRDVMKQAVQNVQAARSSITGGTLSGPPQQQSRAAFGGLPGTSQGQGRPNGFGPGVNGQGGKTSPYGDVDDGSPSSDSFFGADEMAKQDDTAVSRSNEDRYSTPSQAAPFSQTQTRPQQQSPASNRRPYDDASPTADPFDSDSDSQQSGNVWDRLRRQGDTGSRSVPGTGMARSGTQASPQRRPSPTDTDYSFSRADEENKNPQEAAQAKFDATVERERQGGNDDLDAENRRWR